MNTNVPNKGRLHRNALCIAMGLCLASMASMPALAANADGAVVGRTVAGAQLTARNPQTGFIRTVTANADGSYRIPFLPVGDYIIEASKDGATLGTPVSATVSLGNATTVDVGTSNAVDGVSTLGAVQVTGSRVVSMVDVTSTESATNITAAELDRLPVSRDAQSVALLAPGVVNGSFGGISFGGSSVAENTMYINGLNVTDFYKRIGFSTVPFSFFKEFQVKTGGYSVEFGRTTGGVVNAVTKSGTNEFHAGAEVVWEPSWLQANGTDQFNPDGSKVSYKYDEFDNRRMSVYASGPIIKDKLFFYGIYEARNLDQTHVTNEEDQLNETHATDPFWGAKFDWQIADGHSLELLAFKDQNESTESNYVFDPLTGRRGPFNTAFISETGGSNYALTYTGYLTDDLSMRLLYGGNERHRAGRDLNFANCNAVEDRTQPGRPQIGCAKSPAVVDDTDRRKEARADFEWSLGDHLLRFGLDREENTSDYESFYAGPDRLYYQIFGADPGDTVNGAQLPAGAMGYVRTRQQEDVGTFESLNTAYYLEDTWSVTPSFILNAGVRVEGFDNKAADGGTYIKIDDMIAPRLGFSWDVKGDGRSKIFGNLGRYFLPVANVINIKQAGPFLDDRHFYVWNGDLETLDFNGQSYQFPVLGPELGTHDNSQGDGTIPDPRATVDQDIDPVFQDELILGYQSMIDEKWSWSVRGIYRRLHNAIDDMEITYNGFCEVDEFVIANPSKELTYFTDTDCDGVNDAFVTIDTSTEGWALYDDEGNFVGQRGWVKPKRTYKALEFVLDRAWDDKWAMNLSYTLAYGRGNAEGPVNTDTGFDDTGRTEAFDNPFVNLNGYGALPNDRRHQIKFRGTYAINENWQLGATLNAQSGQPINGFGVGNPFDATDFFSFYICVQNCESENASERVYELSPRGSYGRLPWTFDLGASISYLRNIGSSKLRVDFVVFNLLDQRKVIAVDETRQDTIGNDTNPFFLYGTDYQLPRSAQIKVSLDF
jgi:hypothetical protein